jgi:cation transport ATPase
MGVSIVGPIVSRIQDELAARARVLASVAASALGIFGPVIGAIMHEVAAVPVIANAATLIGWKSKKL